MHIFSKIKGVYLSSLIIIVLIVSLFSLLSREAFDRRNVGIENSSKSWLLKYHSLIKAEGVDSYYVKKSLSDFLVKNDVLKEVYIVNNDKEIVLFADRSYIKSYSSLLNKESITSILNKNTNYDHTFFYLYNDKVADDFKIKKKGRIYFLWDKQPEYLSFFQASYFLLFLIIFSIILTSITFFKLRLNDAKFSKIAEQNKANLSSLLSMMGSFAHEIRNVLGGTKLVLDQTLNPDGGEGSICVRNAERIKDLFLFGRSKLAGDDVKTFALKIQEISKNEEHFEEIFQRLNDRTHRVLRITTTIMEYSKSIKLVPGKSRICPHTIIKNIISDIQIELELHKIESDIQVNELIEVKGDEEHFYSIFHNLIINSKDALLESNNKEPKKIEIQSIIHKKSVEFIIKDNGVGIKPENLKNIFKAFFSTKKNTGTGLGLGMVKEMLSLYGGKIEVTSQYGVGTNIHVILNNQLT